MSEVTKRIRIDTKLIGGVDEIGVKFESRLSALEKKMDFLVNTCSAILSSCENIITKQRDDHDCCATLLLPKILYIDDYLRNLHKTFDTDMINEADGLSNDEVLQPSSKVSLDCSSDAKFPILTLNTEEDIPDGCWLGDSSNPKARVRVDIAPALLTHINTKCSTPEKMALSLLDCLFPREILAISNLSGKGKHSKRQLDPVLIYGIRCHLVYKFNIDDKDWNRIKQNIDSKCRTAWRKKVSGLPLGDSYYNTNQTAAEPLSEESSDGVNISSSPVINSDSKINCLDKDTVKGFTDDELKEFLPTPVELFSVVDNECFTLSDQTLIITDSNAEEIVLNSSNLNSDSPQRPLEED